MEIARPRERTTRRSQDVHRINFSTNRGRVVAKTKVKGKQLNEKCILGLENNSQLGNILIE